MRFVNHYNFGIVRTCFACTFLFRVYSSEVNDSPPAGAAVERIDEKLFWDHILYYYAKVEGYDELKYVIAACRCNYLQVLRQVHALKAIIFADKWLTIVCTHPSNR